jgi:predicted Zn-dependent protease
MMIRGLLAIVSMVVLAWLAVLLRDAVLIDRVGSIAFEPHPTANQLARGLSYSRQARFLNPDQSLPQSWEAEMYWLRGQTAPALRVYQRIVAAEPQFADAWFLIAGRAANLEPRLADHALAELKQLDPLYPK